MRLINLNWTEIQEYFKQNDSVIISVGSIEGHGMHLPLGTDTLIPMKILDLIEEKSDVLIAPTIPYGACDSLKEFPGTINLGMDILYSVVKRVCEELYRHGARHFLFLNGHGGNVKALEQVSLDLYDMGAVSTILNWWIMAWDMNVEWKGGHGGAQETAAILAIDEKLVDNSKITDELLLKNPSEDIKQLGYYNVKFKGVEVIMPRKINDVTDSGWIGMDHPKFATRIWGEEMLKTTSEYIAEYIEAFKKVDLPISKR